MASLLSPEAGILVALLSLLIGGLSGGQFLSEQVWKLIGISLVSYLSLKAYQCVWWLEALWYTSEEHRGKSSHIEMRCMYSNLAGHELVRVLRKNNDPNGNNCNDDNLIMTVMMISMTIITMMVIVMVVMIIMTIRMTKMIMIIMTIMLLSSVLSNTE